MTVAARRMLAACCAALAVLCMMHGIDAVTRRQRIVIASGDIARGERVAAGSLSVIDVPAMTAGMHAVERIEDVAGRIALAPIARGQPLYAPMLADSPVAPAGSTTIEVRLASVPDRLIAGDRVDLVSSVGCVQAGEGQPCVLAQDALTLAAPLSSYSAVDAVGSQDSGSSAGSGGALLGESTFGSSADSGSGSSLTVTFALDADEALRVLAQQEAGPLLAVARSDAGETHDRHMEG